MGETRLWEVVRGSTEGVRGTYEWNLDRVYPKITQGLKDNLKRERDNKEWARRGLNPKVRAFVERVSSLSPRVAKITSSDFKRLRNIGKIFDRMPLSDFSVPVIEAYQKLGQALLLQYKDLPIRVYPSGTAKLTYDKKGNPIKDKNGEYVITFEADTGDVYSSSNEMINDVSSDNKMIFYTTGKETFGSDPNADYSKHPLPIVCLLVG